MIKLKKLINESVWDRKFGEPLPTLSSVLEKEATNIPIPEQVIDKLKILKNNKLQ